jgi:hypothetical protein
MRLPTAGTKELPADAEPACMEMKVRADEAIPTPSNVVS